MVKQIRDEGRRRSTRRGRRLRRRGGDLAREAAVRAVLVLVVSIYMLLDMPRLARASTGASRRTRVEPLLGRIEHALVGYVKGQVLLSLIIGASAGVGLWMLGAPAWSPGADKYALLFGGWVAMMELIPYLGPVARRDPAGDLRARRPSGLGALGRAPLPRIHQLEGHIVVPNVMGSALRLHPLLVIFGLLAGGEIYGLAGSLVALPLLAAARAIVGVLRRARRARAVAGRRPIPVEVEVEAAAGRWHPCLLPDPPAAASR